jgi:hypothetical protein
MLSLSVVVVFSVNSPYVYASATSLVWNPVLIGISTWSEPDGLLLCVSFCSQTWWCVHP